MRTWITSDIHFSHRRIMDYCPASRAFSSVEAMDEAIVDRWNSLVSEGDLTYILGDVAFCSAKKATEFLKRLNGDKVLILGNHDKSLNKSADFKQCFKSIHEYLEIEVEGTKVVLFHYPIYSWNGMYRGSLCLHGHTHGNITGIKGRIKDVGLDTNDLRVYNLEDLVKKMLEIELIRDHHEDAK